MPESAMAPRRDDRVSCYDMPDTDHRHAFFRSRSADLLIALLMRRRACRAV